jgi:nucleoid-associated protein YgaU
MIHDQSRLNLVDAVQLTDPVTGKVSQPAYVDLRQRVVGYSADDRVMTVSSALHWSHIGLSYLGDARNWWVIADLSNVVDPFSELEVGAVLRVPSTQRFLFGVMSGGEQNK